MRKVIDFFKNNFILILIFLLALFLRVNYDLFASGYIFDELAMVGLVKKVTLFALIKNIANLDYHAPLYYFLIYPFSSLENEWVYLRLLNLIISIFNVYIFYRIGYLIKDKKFGYFLATLLAVNHLHISVVCFIKFYCLCFLLLSLIILQMINVLKNNTGYLRLGILNGLFCLSNTFGFIFVGMEYLILFCFKKKEATKELLNSILISSVGFLLYFPILFVQAKYALSNIISPHGYYPSFSFFSIYALLNDYISPLLNFSAPLETIEANSLILKTVKDLIEIRTFDWASFLPFLFLSFIPVIFALGLTIKAFKNDILKPISLLAIGYLVFFSLLVCFEVSGFISLYVFPFGILFIFVVGFGIYYVQNKKLRIFLLIYFILIQLVIPNSYPIAKRSPEKMKIFHCPMEYIKKIDNETPIIVTVGGRFLKEYFNDKNIFQFDNEQMGASHNKKFIKMIYGDNTVENTNKKNINKTFKDVILNDNKSFEFRKYVQENIFSKIKKGEKLVLVMNSDENPFIADEKYIESVLSRNDYNYHLADSRFFSLIKNDKRDVFSILLMEDVIMSYSYRYLIDLIDEEFKIINVEHYIPVGFDNWQMAYQNKKFDKNTIWLAKNVINGWIFVTYQKK